MAILGVVTNIGISKSQEAQNNEGFKIYPTNFSVSDSPGLLDPARTTPNTEWFVGPISSRVVVDYNTIKFICTIPPAATPVNRTIREIYIKGTDNSMVDFLFVIGQPSTPIVYDPSGSVTLELDISLTNADLSSAIVFAFTQATEVSEHNLSPNAHPELVEAVNKAGIFYSLGAGPAPFKYRGQAFDEKAEWAGVKASGVYGGVTFTATHTGPDGNSITLSFDGVKTTDQVRMAWNNANPWNTVEHNGTGFEVLSAGTLTLTLGSLSVVAGDVVYRDVDGFYKKALADGSIKSKVAGFADLDPPSKRIVRATGFIARDTTGLAVGDEVFLSASTPGAITNVQTSVKLGIVLSTGVLLIGGQGGNSSGAGADFDAIVTDSPGLNRYPTTQQAVDATSSGGRILVDKLEFLTSTINMGSKRMDFYFTGPETGWTKYLGNAEEQKITFSAVPTSGTWRIEWNGNESVDLPFNATAQDVEDEINAMTGPGLPVTVTGDYTIGFSIVWTSFVDVPQITFNHLGLDEIQQVVFGNVPNDGTLRLNFDGQDTANFAWNDDALLLEAYLEALSTIADVSVSGSFASGQFTVQWTGVDGKQPKNALTVANNSLNLSGSPTTVNINTVQEGRYPASNLKASGNPVTITVQTLVGGTPVGPTTAITVGANYTRFIDLGKIENFDNGIDLNGKVGVDIEMLFNNVVNPIVEGALTPGSDFHTEKSFGVTQQKIRSVGTFGDHADLWLAHTAANDGDKIVVMNDQTLSTNQVLNKDVEIVFVHGAKINVPSVVSGDLLTLGNKTRTKYMRMALLDAGSYDTAFLLSDSRGYHEDLTLEASAGVTVDHAFRINTAATGIFCHGILIRGGATINNGLTNDSGFLNHDVVIRDIEGSVIYDLKPTAAPYQEVPSGVANDINPIFGLTYAPLNADSVIVMVDSLPRFKGVHWNLIGQNIVFTASNYPKTGQDVYVWYLRGDTIQTPPRQLEVFDDLTSILFNAKKINFGTGLSVVQDSSEQVTINAAAGPVSGTWEVEYHTVSPAEELAKGFTMGNTPLAPAKVVVDILQGSGKQFGVDFNIAGNSFLWAGLGLDGVLVAGNVVRMAYFY